MIHKNFILLAEQNQDLREEISGYLEEAGFDVVQSSSGDHAMRLIHVQSFDLVILGVHLPGISGIEVCRSIRSESELPVIMITAKGDDQVILDDLQAWANDFLMQPVRPLELVTRVRTILKRTSVPQAEPDWIVQSGGLMLDLRSHSLVKDGRRVVLALTELRLLSCLMRRAGGIVSKEELLKSVWGYRDVSGDYNLVDTTVKRLRQHIEDDPKKPQYIETVWGVGFRFNDKLAERSK
jgi:two-component system response regulator ResD